MKNRRRCSSVLAIEVGMAKVASQRSDEVQLAQLDNLNGKGQKEYRRANYHGFYHHISVRIYQLIESGRQTASGTMAVPVPKVDGPRGGPEAAGGPPEHLIHRCATPELDTSRTASKWLQWLILIMLWQYSALYVGLRCRAILDLQVAALREARSCIPPSKAGTEVPGSRTSLRVSEIRCHSTHVASLSWAAVLSRRIRWKPREFPSIDLGPEGGM
ncbi:hypothetical protein F4780DRAFT_740502 [Xylariomycetidae sp. FL0641]|nr:hypothetical protein F4780DRAFT_740502 [Xylariomycetidae sp. FL0641]